MEQASAEAGPLKDVTGQAPEEVPVNALLELASEISDKTECVKLAGWLGFSTSEIMQFRQSQDKVEGIAQEILLAWNTRYKEERPLVIIEALEKIKRPDLAKSFQQKCIDFKAKK